MSSSRSTPKKKSGPNGTIGVRRNAAAAEELEESGFVVVSDNDDNNDNSGEECVRLIGSAADNSSTTSTPTRNSSGRPKALQSAPVSAFWKHHVCFVTVVVLVILVPLGMELFDIHSPLQSLQQRASRRKPVTNKTTSSSIVNNNNNAHQEAVETETLLHEEKRINVKQIGGSAEQPGHPLYHPVKRMTTLQGTLNESITYHNISQLAVQQVKNYKNGTGLILHLHITHHGGTTFCGTIGPKNADCPSPPMACRIDVELAKTVLAEKRHLVFPNGFPTRPSWTYDDTASNIAKIRQYFHFLTWEYYVNAPVPHFRDTNWEDHNLLSVIVMRDPMSRLLAGDGWVSQAHKSVYLGTATQDEWWNFARDDSRAHTNNYCLRLLAGRPCCSGKDTHVEYLEWAKALVSRFSFVMDMECLDESMVALGNILGIPGIQPSGKGHHIHPPADERIPYKDVYDYLIEKNKLDIELYEWSKTISLVRCNQPTDDP